MLPFVRTLTNLFDHLLEGSPAGRDQGLDGGDLLADGILARRQGRPRGETAAGGGAGGVVDRVGRTGRRRRRAASEGLVVERGVAGADVVLAGTAGVQEALRLALLDRVRGPHKELLDADNLKNGRSRQKNQINI